MLNEASNLKSYSVEQVINARIINTKRKYYPNESSTYISICQMYGNANYKLTTYQIVNVGQ